MASPTGRGPRVKHLAWTTLLGTEVPQPWQDETPASLGCLRGLGPGVGGSVEGFGIHKWRFPGLTQPDKMCSPLAAPPGQKQGTVGGGRQELRQVGRSFREQTRGRSDGCKKRRGTAGRGGSSPAGKVMAVAVGSVQGGLSKANAESCCPWA